MQNNKSKAEVVPEKFVDEQKEKRIHEHLMNQNDVISEEDIKNVRTDVSEGNTQPPPPAEPEIKENPDDSLEKEKIKDNNDPAIETSWNILGE